MILEEWTVDVALGGGGLGDDDPPDDGGGGGEGEEPEADDQEPDAEAAWIETAYFLQGEECPEPHCGGDNWLRLAYLELPHFHSTIFCGDCGGKLDSDRGMVVTLRVA